MRLPPAVPLLAALALAGPVPAASAADFHVDPSAGDDAAAGTAPDRPWRSLARASAADLAPGDRVLLRGGARHPGTLVLGAEDAGTPDRLVAVGSYGTGRAIIEAGTAAGIKVYNAGGVAVRDVRVTGAGRELGNRANGIEVYTDLGGARKLDAIRVERVEVSGFGSAGVTVGAWPADGTKSGFRGVRITDVSAHHNADAGVSTWGRTSSTATGYAHADVVVDRVQAYDNPGIAGKGSNSGSGIVIGDVTGALVQRSVAFRNGARNDFAGGGPVGIWAWDSHAVTIQDNESYANASATIDGGGFDLDGGVTGSVLQRNLSHGNAGAGFLLYQYSGARPWGGNTVRFNVSDGDGRTNLAGIYVGGGAGGAQVHHNTVVTRARPSGAMPHAVGVEGARDVRVRDNALATTGTGTLVSVGAGQAGIRFEGNAYPSGAVIRDGDRTVTGLAAWRSLRGQELLDGRGVGVEGAARLPATGDAASTLTAGTVPRERYRPGTGSVLTGTAIDLRARFALDPGPADLVGTLFGTRVPADVGAVQPRPVATTTTTATSSSPAAEDGGAPAPAPAPAAPAQDPDPADPAEDEPAPDAVPDAEDLEPVPAPAGEDADADVDAEPEADERAEPAPGVAAFVPLRPEPPAAAGGPDAPAAAPAPAARVALRPLTATARSCRPVRLGAELVAAGAGALRIRATVDGRSRPARLDRRAGVVRLAAVRLAPGRHTVRVRVAGRGVPAATRTWTVTVRRC